MTIFAKNQDHTLHVREVNKVIERQPWAEPEKTMVKSLFQNTRHGQVTGKQIDLVFKHLKNRPNPRLQPHHLKNFHDQLSHPFTQTMPSPGLAVAAPRLRL
jgi:hypothetical protein